jgi:hypothetical protein
LGRKAFHFLQVSLIIFCQGQSFNGGMIDGNAIKTDMLEGYYVEDGYCNFDKELETLLGVGATKWYKFWSSMFEH